MSAAASRNLRYVIRGLVMSKESETPKARPGADLHQTEPRRDSVKDATKQLRMFQGIRAPALVTLAR